MTQEIPGRTKIVTGKTNSIHSTNNVSDRLINNNPFMPDVPLHPDLLLRAPKQQTIKQNMQEINPNPNINFDFEENSPFQEGIMSETFQRLDRSFFQNPRQLGDLINKEKLVHRFFPKQTDIIKILEVIQREALKGTHLPVEIKQIEVGYLYSPYFKDLYLYLLQNGLPGSKSTIRKLETLSVKYVLLDSLLFRISPEKERVVLAIPETCADKIITLYHKSLFAVHQGVIKTYLTISDKFFIPNLIHNLMSYIKGCHICQVTLSHMIIVVHTNVQQLVIYLLVWISIINLLSFIQHQCLRLLTESVLHVYIYYYLMKDGEFCIVFYIHTYIHTYMHAYIHTCIDSHRNVTGGCTGTLDGLVGSHIRLAIHPTLAIHC